MVRVVQEVEGVAVIDLCATQHVLHVGVGGEPSRRLKANQTIEPTAFGTLRAPTVSNHLQR